jgi:hypothetical protein
MGSIVDIIEMVEFELPIRFVEVDFMHDFLEVDVAVLIVLVYVFMAWSEVEFERGHGCVYIKCIIV